ncbi:hypothetical protein L6452_35533 [Arctium lappa]|uniref:Uncharacterized protein n=1 Tax=Arctium lappa TaxID=4217 RepID=A0ACB8Y5Y2_ARCLA|nr:hypothetical protein L6452_35533 [Arctium lappa]
MHVTSSTMHHHLLAYCDFPWELCLVSGKLIWRFILALSIKPNFSQSLNNLGVVYTVQDKMDAAASMIEKAIVANPTYAEAYNNLGLFLSLASNIVKSVVLIVAVLVQSYGVLYRDVGSISLAIEAYEQCLKKDPDSRNAG